MTHAEQGPNGEEPRVVVRDRRRIDPATGAVRTPDPAPGTSSASGPRHAAPDPGPAPAAVSTDGANDAIVDATVVEEETTDSTAELRTQLDERTSDLQRVSAEYANYRRRVERDREAVVLAAKAAVVGELLPVLDDLERAKAHGDLTGAFKAVADKLTATLEKAGLTAFGSEGDEFNPSVHQAVQHSTSPDVAGPTVTAVLRRGYQLGERLLRTAMVGVTDHEPGADPVAAPAEPTAARPVQASAEPAPDESQRDQISDQS